MSLRDDLQDRGYRVLRNCEFPNYIVMKSGTLLFAKFVSRSDLYEREVQALEEVREHPHVPTIRDHFSRERDTGVIIEDFVEGVPLPGSILDADAISFVAYAQVLRDTCDMLEYAHNKGRVHFDVKRTNVFRSWTGTKVIDWDASVRIGEEFDTAIWTLTTFPPEIEKGSVIEGDPAIDVYGIAHVLGEYVASLEEVMIPEKRAVAPTLDSQYVTSRIGVVHGLLDRTVRANPHDRIQTASEMKAALEELLGSQEFQELSRHVAGRVTH